jgi:hypothetical protein
MIDTKQLIEIIEDLKKVTNETTPFFIPYETIFEQACSYQRGILANQNRSAPKINSSQVGGSGSSREVVGGESDKPTDKQIAFLRKNEVFIPEDLTKREATQMISEFKKNLDKRYI